MKLQQKFRLADLYNRPDTTIIVASFPGRKDRSIKDIDAVASYTDHFTRALKRELGVHNKRLVILAQKIDGQEEWYKEGDMLVCRVWDKGSASCFTQILSAISFFGNVKSVVIQFEFHQFGGKITTAFFPMFLAGLKFMGKSVILTMHQVVVDITSLSGHLNILPDTKRALFFNAALKGFYRVVDSLADCVIVHNTVLANRYKQLTGRTDTVIIPHGLGAIHSRFSKIQARKILGYKKDEFVIMYFGFMAWYKGVDWLVNEVVRSHRKNIRLVIAGGVSPNIQDAPHYQKFIRSIQSQTTNNPRITVTGFVEDSEIPLYFAGCDAVVLPYRTLMSSSGPLAMTLAFKKPFLISKALTPYTEDADFTQALQTSGLSTSDISFRLNTSDFWKKLTALKRHPKRFSKLARLLRQKRTWPVVATQFYEAIKQYSLEPAGKFAIMQSRDPAGYART